MIFKISYHTSQEMLHATKMTLLMLSKKNPAAYFKTRRKEQIDSVDKIQNFGMLK